MGREDVCGGVGGGREERDEIGVLTLFMPTLPSLSPNSLPAPPDLHGFGSFVFRNKPRWLLGMGRSGGSGKEREELEEWGEWEEW